MAGSAVIGALRVNLGLNSAEFQNSIKQSQAASSKFAASMKVTFTAMAASAGAALAGLAVSIRSSLGEVDEIAKQAQISNTGFEDFQRLAFAARSVGIEGDKLSDIFKDVNDRVGDFNQTGGGPMKDFFEQIAPKVNLTADAFKNLSGPQALQLYYDSLKKAGANQQQMTFYLEAMASDATALIPLLERGGEGFRKLGEGASVISTASGAQLKEFNQSVRNLGQSFADVGLTAVATMAPALAVVATGFDAIGAGMRSAIQYLPQVAEYAAVAGGTLAVLAAPAIVASIASLAAAIGTGVVGALKAVAVAIAANPLGALVLGITAAVTAAYHFRDEIKAAIGVDVVQIAKRGANMFIGSFMTAFDTVKFYFKNFPTIVGAGVTSAVNLVIKALNSMVNGARRAINDLISAANFLPGADFDLLDTNGKAIAELANNYTAPLNKALKELNDSRAANMSKDWIGTVAQAFKGATPAVIDFGNAVATTGKQLASGAGSSKGGGGKTEAESYADIVDKANRRIASLKAEQAAIGLTEQAAAELVYQTDLLNMAQQQGITLTDGQRSEFSALAHSMAAIEAATDRMREALEFAKDATKGFLSDFRQGLANGESAWKSFGSAALSVLDKIIGKIETQLVDAIFSMGGTFGGVSGGSTGLLGGLFSGLGKIFGFASGGTILPGGAGGIDSQLVMFRKSPTERVDITKPGQTLRAGQGGVTDVQVGVSVDQNGNLDAYVKRISQREAASAVDGYDRKVLPSRVQSINSNPRVRN